MHRLLPMLLYERCRRYKKFVMEKPFLAIGVLGSVIYMSAGVLANPLCVSDFLDYPIATFAVMVYLVAKIINPTQGMILDYQLLELKLISLREYKILLGIKLLGGSILLSLICIGSYTKMVAIISALNATVNVWIFLRNRWNNRLYDLLVAMVVIFSVKYQILSLSILGMIVMVGVYIVIKRVNYDAVLSLYKLIYKIGQQRFHGVVYSETESRNIQTNAESLIGKAKEKNADWCERLYPCGWFMVHKELARVMANFNKLITYFIICILISMSGFYIPEEYRIFIFILLATIAMSFDMVMNKSEVNLLLRGFIKRYVVSDIVKDKLFVYTVVNFVLMCPAAVLGWKWGILVFAGAFFIALGCLYKCFRVKRKLYSNKK